MRHHLVFSVVVPTCHRHDSLAACLERLAPGAQTFAAGRYEVVVTDDASPPTARELLAARFAWARWVAGPGRGPAANRNRGAHAAGGEWLAFTDDDCLPEVDWLQTLADAITPEAAALEGAIHPLGDPSGDLSECPINLQGQCFWSANIAVRRQLFLELDGFDVNYPCAAHEDQDLMLRLSRMTQVKFVPAAIVRHPVRALTLRQAVGRIPMRCRTWAYHAWKNRERLGYSTDWSIIRHAYQVHARLLARHLPGLLYKTVVVELCVLIYGMPLMWSELRRLAHRPGSTAAAA